MTMTHGLPGTYSCGCRCVACTEANRIRMIGVRAYLRDKPFDEIPHGTTNGYSNYCCRCPECKAVGSARNHAARLRRYALMAADEAPEFIKHGRESTYSNWGCRCEECCAAARTTWRNRDRRRRRPKQGTWAKSKPI